jgi:hypothetical protein
VGAGREGVAVEGGEESEQEYQLESAGAGVMTVMERWVVGMAFLSLFASSRRSPCFVA